MIDSGKKDAVLFLRKNAQIEHTYDLIELTPEGEVENPPDRLRDELGLEKPRKQVIETPSGRMFVDRPTSLDGLF